MVINTSPLISLIAALGDLTVLKSLYQQVLVPWEVCQEIQTGGARGFAVAEFEQATFLKKYPTPLEIPPFLRNSLDRGEAAVIQLALTEQISTVCIDEAAGRRVARLHGLSLTGSVGILIRAQREGYPFAMPQALARMRERGIWLSERVIRMALEQGH
jgi:predicted nucleic acid-binding protein